MNQQLIIAGFGGQGVLSMGQLLAYAGMLEGKNVSWLPSYGPEMRGGTANCHVIISDSPVGSPLVTEATAAIVMNKPSLDKFESAVIPGGLLLVNSSLIDRKSIRNDIETVYIPANDLAVEMNNEKVANMIILGAYLKKTQIVQAESVLESLKKVLGPGKEKLIPVNREALSKGASLV
ncbi:MAG: 2-oxoacid:acceptor oxidoreductase family protein [Christensenellales bacterium]